MSWSSHAATWRATSGRPASSRTCAALAAAGPVGAALSCLQVSSARTLFGPLPTGLRGHTGTARSAGTGYYGDVSASARAGAHLSLPDGLAPREYLLTRAFLDAPGPANRRRLLGCAPSAWSTARSRAAEAGEGVDLPPLGAVDPGQPRHPRSARTAAPRHRARRGRLVRRCWSATAPAQMGAITRRPAGHAPRPGRLPGCSQQRPWTPVALPACPGLDRRRSTSHHHARPARIVGGRVVQRQLSREACHVVHAGRVDVARDGQVRVLGRDEQALADLVDLDSSCEHAAARLGGRTSTTVLRRDQYAEGGARRRRHRAGQPSSRKSSAPARSRRRDHARIRPPRPPRNQRRACSRWPVGSRRLARGTANRRVMIYARARCADASLSWRTKIRQIVRAGVRAAGLSSACACRRGAVRIGLGARRPSIVDRSCNCGAAPRCRCPAQQAPSPTWSGSSPSSTRNCISRAGAEQAWSWRPASPQTSAERVRRRGR